MYEALVNPYKGFNFGNIYLYETYVRRNRQLTVPVNDESWVTPMFPVVADHTIVWIYNEDGLVPKQVMGSDWAEVSSCFFDESYNQISGKGGRSARPIVVVPTGAAYAVFASTVEPEDFYVYDRTANEYILRGSNVTANSQ